MGIEKKEIVSKQTIKTYTCDICGNRADDNHYQCQMCKKIMCVKHVVFDIDMGDYPDKYCRVCWEIGDEHRKDIDVLQSQFDSEVEQIERKWERDCINNVLKNFNRKCFTLEKKND